MAFHSCISLSICFTLDSSFAYCGYFRLWEDFWHAVRVCILTLGAVMCWLLLLCTVLSSVTQAFGGSDLRG